LGYSVLVAVSNVNFRMPPSYAHRSWGKAFDGSLPAVNAIAGAGRQWH